MERLLLEQFLKEENVPFEDSEVILKIVQSCTWENLLEALEDQAIVNFMVKYQDFERNVLEGHLGKTTTFWMPFVHHCHHIVMLLHSVKTNNLKLFHKCNG